jgi:hypothetical protein
MKIGTVMYVLSTGAVALALSASANGQPRPAPPMGERSAQPAGVRARDNNNREVAAEHHETEAQLRARLQREQDEKTAQRQAERKDARAWETSRDQRAARDRSEIASNWGDIAEQPDAKAELATHAERMAQLNRILDVAKDQGDAGLAARTNAVIQRELARDARALQGIRARVGGR